RSPTFWCPERSKVDFVDEVKLLFHSSDGLPPNVTLAKTSFPLWELQDDLVRLRYDVAVRSGKFQGEGYLIVSTRRLPEGDLSPKSWRVEALELLNGRSAQQGPPGGPRGPPGL